MIEKAKRAVQPVKYYDDFYAYGRANGKYDRGSEYVDAILKDPVIVSVLAQAKNIMDIGSGPGAFLEKLKESFDFDSNIEYPIFINVDFSEEAHTTFKSLLRESGSTSFECLDFMNAGVIWRSEVVFCFETGEHIDTPEFSNILLNLKQNVYPGGLLVMTLPQRHHDHMSHVWICDKEGINKECMDAFGKEPTFIDYSPNKYMFYIRL